MHVAHKVLAERYEEQDAQDSSEGRSQEDLHKRSGHLGILGLQNIDGWQGEDGSRHHGTRTGSDTLYDDILAISLVGTHQGFILLTVLQLTEGILGEVHFFFHRV